MFASVTNVRIVGINMVMGLKSWNHGLSKRPLGSKPWSLSQNLFAINEVLERKKKHKETFGAKRQRMFYGPCGIDPLGKRH